MATASRCCRRWRSRARSTAAATFACCASPRRSPSARSGWPGAKLRPARRSSRSSASCYATSCRNPIRSQSRREAENVKHPNLDPHGIADLRKGRSRADRAADLRLLCRGTADACHVQRHGNRSIVHGGARLRRLGGCAWARLGGPYQSACRRGFGPDCERGAACAVFAAVRRLYAPRFSRRAFRRGQGAAARGAGDHPVLVPGAGRGAAWVRPARRRPVFLAGCRRYGCGVALIFVGTLIGGMRSLSLSQIAQYAVLFAVSLAAVMVVLWQTGTLFGAEVLLLDEVIPSFGLQDFAQSDAVNRFALIFCLACGTASLPYLLMRSFTTPTPGEARTSFLASLLFVGILCLAAPAFAALFEAAWINTGDALPMIAAGALTLAAIAGVLAAGSALALSIANAISYDVYFKSVQPGASARRRVFVARLSVILVAGLAAGAAVAAPQETLTATSAALSLA